MWGAPTILEAAVSWVSRPYVTLIPTSSGPEQRSDLSRGRSHLGVSLVVGPALHGTSHVELHRSYESRTGSRPVTGTHFAVIMAGPVVINVATAGDWSWRNHFAQDRDRGWPPVLRIRRADAGSR
jgi:hypothetical protein